MLSRKPEIVRSSSSPACSRLARATDPELCPPHHLRRRPTQTT
jgi:hypothetical protein